MKRNRTSITRTVGRELEEGSIKTERDRMQGKIFRRQSIPVDYVEKTSCNKKTVVGWTTAAKV